MICSCDWRILCSSSNYSLVNGGNSGEDFILDSSLVHWKTQWSWFYALLLFKLDGFPWMFPKVSWVCQYFLQKLFHGLFFQSFSFFTATRAEESIFFVSILGSIFSITFLLVSSPLISEKVSLKVGSGFFPRIQEQSSSNSWFNPARNR